MLLKSINSIMLRILWELPNSQWWVEKIYFFVLHELFNVYDCNCWIYYISRLPALSLSCICLKRVSFQVLLSFGYCRMANMCMKYSITRLNRISWGRLFYFGSEIFRFKKGKDQEKKSFRRDISFGSSNRFSLNGFGLTVLYCITLWAKWDHSFHIWVVQIVY